MSAVIAKHDGYLDRTTRSVMETTIGWLNGTDMKVKKEELLESWGKIKTLAEQYILPRPLLELASSATESLALPNSILPAAKDTFVKVSARDLHIEDRFFAEHVPANIEERRLKLDLLDLITEGKIDDFFAPKVGPSFEGDYGKYYHDSWEYCEANNIPSSHGTHEDAQPTPRPNDDSMSIIEPGDGRLFFHKGCERFSGSQFTWWQEMVERFIPGHSWIGSIGEYLVFCGFFIKFLVDEQGWSVQDAWGAVCCDKPFLKNNAFGFHDLKKKKVLSAGRLECGYMNYRDYCYACNRGEPLARITTVATCDWLDLGSGSAWIVCDIDPTQVQKKKT